MAPSQDQTTIQDVQDNSFPPKKAFAKSLETTGNIPGAYIIHLEPFIPPVQHTKRKVPIECREAIEKVLQEMVDMQIIAPVTEPIEWVSSLTYPQKPDKSVCICLDPHELNKAIIQEQYKMPNLNEITHRLSSTTVFSKLDTKVGF